MKVKKFASYQGTLVLDEFYQLCMNIDPVTRCSVCYFRQRTDACLGKKITFINVSLRVLN